MLRRTSGVRSASCSLRKASSRPASSSLRSRSRLRPTGCGARSSSSAATSLVPTWRSPRRAVRPRAEDRARLRYGPLGRDRPAPSATGWREKEFENNVVSLVPTKLTALEAVSEQDPQLELLKSENRRLQDEIERLRG